MNQKGFAPILIILSVVLLLGVAGGAFYVGKIVTTPPGTLPIITPSPKLSPTLIPNSVVDETANWKIYTNTKYNLSFKYPEKWMIDREDPNFVVLQTFKSPNRPYGGWAGGKKDITLSIGVKSNEEQLTIDQYLTETRKYSVVQSKENLVVAGISAIRVRYQDEIGAGMPNVYFLKDKNFVDISLNYGQDIGEEAEKIFSQILSTFKFLN